MSDKDSDKDSDKGSKKHEASKLLPTSLSTIQESDTDNPAPSPRRSSIESATSEHITELARSVSFAPAIQWSEKRDEDENELNRFEQQDKDVPPPSPSAFKEPSIPILKPVPEVEESRRWQHGWKEEKKDPEPILFPSLLQSNKRPDADGESVPQGGIGQDSLSPSIAAITQTLPADALKTTKIQRPKPGTTPDRPLAPKMLVLKRAPGHVPPPIESDHDEDIDIPKPFESDFPYVLHSSEKMFTDTPDDKDIDKKLTQMMNIHRDYLLRKLKRKKRENGPQFRFPEMVDTLTSQGIPLPVNEDYGRLHGMHSRWDPKGTVLEYYSPMLRTFVPVNMRGRYRGCWTTDNCVKGLNISSIHPKRDALEGFVDRGRHNNIQAKYKEMSKIASDVAHLDYLIEIQAYHAESLPIPIFYDMLHIGIEVANENLRILVQDEGFPPNDLIFTSAHEHAEQLRRKIQMYGALGLETLESERKGLGQYRPEWLKTRDEIIRDIMKAKDEKRYANLEKTEKDADFRGEVRREQSKWSAGNSRTSKSRPSYLTRESRKSSTDKSRGSKLRSSINPDVEQLFVNPSMDAGSHTFMEQGIGITPETAPTSKMSVPSPKTIPMKSAPTQKVTVQAPQNVPGPAPQKVPAETPKVPSKVSGPTQSNPEGSAQSTPPIPEQLTPSPEKLTPEESSPIPEQLTHPEESSPIPEQLTHPEESSTIPELTPIEETVPEESFASAPKDSGPTPKEDPAPPKLNLKTLFKKAKMNKVAPEPDPEENIKNLIKELATSKRSQGPETEQEDEEED